MTRQQALELYLKSRRAQGLPDRLPEAQLIATAADVRSFLADEITSSRAAGETAASIDRSARAS